MQMRPAIPGILIVALRAAYPAGQESTAPPPRDWIDPDTGHRVIRLSEKPGSQSLYFHQNAYTPDGTRLLITTPTGLAAVDLRSRAVEEVVDGRVSAVMTGKKTGRAVYVRAGVVYAVDLTSKVSTGTARLPPHAAVASVNADETLLAGTLTEGPVPGSRGTPARETATPPTNGRPEPGRDRTTKPTKPRTTEATGLTRAQSSEQPCGVPRSSLWPS